MRLSKSSARTLNRAIWQDRLRRFGGLSIIIAAVAALAIVANSYRAASSDPTIDVHPINATVIATEPGQTTRRGYVFRARLAEGRDVDALAPGRIAPPPGARVVLSAAQHKSGRFSYELMKLAD